MQAEQAGEFPAPEDEVPVPGDEEDFERLYADELELLRDAEERPRGTPAALASPSPSLSHPSIHVSSEDSNFRTIGYQPYRSKDCARPTVKKQLFTEPTTENQPDSTKDAVANARLSQDITELSVTQETVTNGVQPNSTDTTSKRTAQDLFGDIDDIDFNELELPSKRHKPNFEEDADLILIEKILEGRKLKKSFLEPGKSLRNNKAGSYNVNENLSYDIPRWPFLPVTRASGERVYIRFHSEEYMEAELKDVTGSASVLQDHLHTAYSQVWEEARAILDKKLNLESDTERERGEHGQSQMVEELQALEQQASVEADDSQLWVERYRPRCYAELLSDEPINRSVLHWLKLWDKIVFNREVRTEEPQQRTSFNRRAGKFEAGGWRGVRGRAAEEPELDERGRPRQKAVLLCGPPGAGKSTLAHLIARHAGYRPLEVNASDDRSVDAFKTALENATRMQSVIDPDKRPNCLILDEIDGAPLATIEYLVKFCSGVGLGKPGKGQKAKTQELRRPIICICNDAWAPSLRPLRSVARVVHFPAASAVRLARRLAEVAALQGLRADPSALTALAERAAGDVRACLAILYFFKAKDKQIRLSDVLRLNVGQKDSCKSVMQVQQEIFYAAPQPAADNQNKAAVAAGRFHTLLHMVSSAGDYDRLASGVFENYVALRPNAPMLTAVCALDWFRSLDALQSYIQRTQNYALYPHLPLAFVRWHRLLASTQRQYVKFPTQGHEMYVQQQRTRAILTAVERGVSPRLGPFCSRLALTLDVLPFLSHIITPALKSANIQLYSERERGETGAVVSAMCDYGLTYAQQRTAEATYAYTLDPDINRIAFFDGGTVRNLPYAVKQTLAREVQLELMRRAELKVHDTSSSQSGKSAKTVARPASSAPAALPNHLQRLEPKKISITPVTHKDFFGRVVPKAATGSGSNHPDGRADLIASSSVFYHYQEGFNNAVRRSVRMQDLL